MRKPKMPVRTRSSRAAVPLDVVIDVLFETLSTDLHNLSTFWAVWTLILTCKEAAAAITETMAYTLMYLRHYHDMVPSQLFRDGLGRFNLDVEATLPSFGNVEMIQRLGRSAVEDPVQLRIDFAKNTTSDFGSVEATAPKGRVGCFVGFLRSLHRSTLQTFPTELHPCEICGWSACVSDKPSLSSTDYWNAVQGKAQDNSWVVCSAPCAKLSLQKQSNTVCYSNNEIDPVVVRRRGGDIPSATLLKAAFDRNVEIARRMRRNRGDHQDTIAMLNVDTALLVAASLLAELPVRHRRKLPSSSEFRNQSVFWLKAVCTLRKLLKAHPEHQLLTASSNSRFLSRVKDGAALLF